MLKVAPIARPIPSATNEIIKPTATKMQKRQNCCGNPDIQYVTAMKVMLSST